MADIQNNLIINKVSVFLVNKLGLKAHAMKGICLKCIFINISLKKVSNYKYFILNNRRKKPTIKKNNKGLTNIIDPRRNIIYICFTIKFQYI